jgi:hypothetical protein
MTMLTTRSAFLMALSLSLLITGCGGGGGGGSSDTVIPPPSDVMIGTIAFNPASSRDIASHTFGFPTNIVQAWRITTSITPNGDYNSMTFADATIVVGATLLPVYRITYTYGSYAPGSIAYSYWATATNGGIYNLTGQDGTDGGGGPTGPEVMATQPRLILPPAPTISNSWTADGVTGFGAGYAINGATRTVMSMSATSPAGFTGCMRIRAVSPAGSLPTNVDEYWKPGYGVVEALDVDTATPSTIFFRTGIAFSG